VRGAAAPATIRRHEGKSSVGVVVILFVVKNGAAGLGIGALAQIDHGNSAEAEAAYSTYSLQRVESA
jgi:hypothetical protein